MRNHLARYGALAALAAGSPIALAQTPTLVKDLSPGFVANSSDPKYIWSDGTVAYGWCGNGLFRTDGTMQGTWIVYDPATSGPGAIDQQPLFGLSRTLACTYKLDPFTLKFRGRLLSVDPQGHSATPLWNLSFNLVGSYSLPAAKAGDAFVLGNIDSSPDAAAWDLWRTDGTDAGTTRLIAGLSPGFFFGAGDHAYFTAPNPEVSGERNLWVSDGTLEGTRVMPAFLNHNFSATPQGIGSIGNDALFRRFSPASRWEIWRTDGTDANTIRLADGPGPTPNNSLSFSTYGQVGDRHYSVPSTFPASGIWVTQGTVQTTAPVPLPAGYSSPYIRASGPNGIYVEATTASGVVLGLLDPSNQFTPLYTSPQGVSVYEAAHVAYFSRSSGSGVVDLVVTDGTPAGTHAINFPATLNPKYFATIGDKLVFNGTDASGDKELWVTDGTDQGTHLLADMRSNNPSTNPLAMIPTPQGLVFAGNSSLNLYATDGTPAGTSPLPSPAAQDPNQTGIILKFPAASQTFYSVGSSSTSSYRSLWVTDGTSAGTRALLELPSGGGISGSSGPIVLGDKIVFPGPNPGALTGDEPMVSDGTVLGTRRLADINPGSAGSTPVGMYKYGSRAFFRATSPATGSEPWITDGTPEGTIQLGDLNPGTGGSNATARGIVGGLLFFSTNFSSLNRLWATDGTPAGTRPVNDTSGNPFQSTFFRSTSTGGDRLYFAAVDAVGSALWRVSLDGTTAQRHWLAGPTSASGVYGLTPFNGQCAFWAVTADSSQTGLWITDDSISGAHLLRAFPLADGAVIPSRIVVHNGLLLVVMSSLTTYATPTVLWRSDGTPQGTVPVTSILPFSQYIGTALAEYDLLYPLAGGPMTINGSTETGGYECFVTDGYQLRPIEVAAGPMSSRAGTPVVADGVVYIVANDGVVGQELWSIPLADIQFPPHCDGDFNLDGAVDFFDYDDFVVCFEGGACPPGNPAPTADFDHDGTVDFFDYDAFVLAFETPC